jgi:hypothetical protein
VTTSATFAHSTATPIHYTPPEYRDAISDVLDGIELDAASDTYANLLIKAERFFTEQDDGLSKYWEARSVLVNPPGGNNKIDGDVPAKTWAKRALEEWQHRRADRLIFVGFNASILWTFQEFLSLNVCYPKQRMRFFCSATSKELIDRFTDKQTGAFLTEKYDSYIALKKSNPENHLQTEHGLLIRSDRPQYNNAIVHMPCQNNWVEETERFLDRFSAFGAVRRGNAEMLSGRQQ